MEDDNGLELSLGLSCGGSSAKSKGKTGGISDARAEEGDRGNTLADDFKNFLHPGIQKQDSSTSSQRSDPVKPQENFFSNFPKASVESDAPMNLNGRGLWVANNNRSSEVEEEKRTELGNKRKMLFEDVNHQKKHEREAHHADLHERTKTSHISITTEDGSTAENEDVAESEVDVSTSRLVSHHDDGSKRFIGASGSSEVPKEVHGLTDSSVVDLQGQKRFNISSENEFKQNLGYGVPFQVQPVNIMNMPYSLPVKESNSVGAPSTSGYPLPGMMQVMSPANCERAGIQPVNNGNLPLMFGYSNVQLPMLDKNNSWGLVSHSQQFHPNFVGRAPPNTDKHNDVSKISQAVMQAIPHNSSEASPYDGRMLELTKGDGKQHPAEEGSSCQTEDDGKGNNVIFRAKDGNDQATTEVFSYESSALRPGIAADLKFGGSGSHPNLPWVSTTGPGPNGKTISGVTYRFSRDQIKIVCACHGSHMSPEEFIQHAGEEHANPETGTGLASFPNGNPATSAQS